MKLAEAVDRLVKVAPPLIQHYFSPNCCIAATRIAMEVLQGLGFQTRAQPTYFVVYTKNLWNRRHDFDGKFLEGEWSVAIGHGVDNPRGPKGYDGHLVCMANDGREERLVDMTVGQASRPHKGIELPQAWHWEFKKWPTWFESQKTIVMYEPKTNPEFVRSPDWRIWSRTDPLIEQILETFK